MQTFPHRPFEANVSKSDNSKTQSTQHQHHSPAQLFSHSQPDVIWRVTSYKNGSPWTGEGKGGYLCCQTAHPTWFALTWIDLHWLSPGHYSTRSRCVCYTVPFSPLSPNLAEAKHAENTETLQKIITIVVQGNTSCFHSFLVYPILWNHCSDILKGSRNGLNAKFMYMNWNCVSSFNSYSVLHISLSFLSSPSF